jgi:hypothetical protein
MKETPWDLATYRRAYENLMGTAKKLRAKADRLRAENEKLRAEVAFFAQYEDLIMDIHAEMDQSE